jgi:hypothetical protein
MEIAGSVFVASAPIEGISLGHVPGDFRVGEFADAGWNLHNRESTQHGSAEKEICMAQQVNVKFVDDLDGSDAAGTVSFAIDGRAYEIDLSNENANIQAERGEHDVGDAAGLGLPPPAGDVAAVFWSQRICAAVSCARIL